MRNMRHRRARANHRDTEAQRKTQAKRTKEVLLCVSVSLWLVFSLHAIAQEPAPPQSGFFGCGTPEQPQRTDFTVDPPLRFKEVAAPAEREDWMHRRFDGFEAKKYGFTAVEFFVHPVKTTGYSGHYGDDESKITAMELYLRVSDSSAQHWYLLENTAQYGASQESLFLQEGGLQPEESVPSDDNEKPKAPKDPLDDWMTLTPATPDPHLPLFTIVDAYGDHGANAGGTLTNNLLIDVTSGKPVLKATAQCIEWEGGGVCGAPDTSNLHWQSTSCTWQQKLSDFLCTTTGSFGGSYNPVNAREEFLLLSGKHPEALSWAPDALPSIEAFVKTLPPKPKPGLGGAPTGLGGAPARALVKNVGYVDLLWQSDSLLPGKKVLLLGSVGAGEFDNARFRIVALGPDGTVTVAAIPKWVLGGEESDDDKEPPDFTPSDNDIHITAREFATAKGAHLLKAVYARGTGGSITRVLYLVGLQVKDGKVVTNAVRLASNGTRYMHCGQEAADSTAIAFSWVPAESGANVVVQPGDSDQIEPPDPAPCSWAGKLRWVDGVGFRVRKLRDMCKALPKDVTINDLGNITTKPRVAEPR